MPMEVPIVVETREWGGTFARRAAWLELMTMLRAIRRPEDRREHSALEMGNLLMLQERERFLVKHFALRGIRSLEEFRVFAAGCSAGYNLRLMVQGGARPENVVGMEIDPSQANYVASRSSQIRVHVGSADSIPGGDKTFDLGVPFR